eukprot:531708-Karenia_brevis.AAC.1
MTKYIAQQKSLKSQGETPDSIEDQISTPTVHVFNTMVKYVMEHKELPPSKGESLMDSVKGWSPMK